MPWWCSSLSHPNVLVVDCPRPLGNLQPASPHLDDGGRPAAPPRRLRRGRQQDRLVLRQRFQERLDPVLREARVELVGGEEGSLVRRLRDRPPLGELDQRDRPRDLPGGRRLRQGPPAALPEQVVALRTGQGVAPATLDGRDPLAGGPKLCFRKRIAVSLVTRLD